MPLVGPFRLPRVPRVPLIADPCRPPLKTVSEGPKNFGLDKRPVPPLFYDYWSFLIISHYEAYPENI